MAKKTVGELIREARTGAGLTQEQLAAKIENVSAGDISKAERGEKQLTQAALKAIAKATGVTQKSLLEAAAPAKKPAATTKTTTAAKKTATTTKASTTAKKAATTTKASTTAKKAATTTKASTAAKKAATTTKASTTAKKTATTTKASTAAKKTTAKKEEEIVLTAAEKRVLALYRAADANTRKAAEALLKGEQAESGLAETILGLLGNIVR